MKIYRIAQSFPSQLSASQMVDFITDNNLRDWNGGLEYQDAKDIAYWVDTWRLTELPLSLFNWTADPKYRNKSKNIPPIVLKSDGSYEVLDGKHRIGMAKAMGLTTIQVYLGDADDSQGIT